MVGSVDNRPSPNMPLPFVNKKMILTPDTWHLTCDTWWGVNILSRFQLPSSNGLGYIINRDSSFLIKCHCVPRCTLLHTKFKAKLFTINLFKFKIKMINLSPPPKTRRGNPVDRRPSTAEAPLIGKIQPFSKIAEIFWTTNAIWCL